MKSKLFFNSFSIALVIVTVSSFALQVSADEQNAELQNICGQHIEQAIEQKYKESYPFTANRDLKEVEQFKAELYRVLRSSCDKHVLYRYDVNAILEAAFRSEQVQSTIEKGLENSLVAGVFQRLVRYGVRTIQNDICASDRNVAPANGSIYNKPLFDCISTNIQIHRP